MANDKLPELGVATARLQELLDAARLVKKTDDIEPPLVASDFGGRIEQLGQTTSNGVSSSEGQAQPDANPQTQYAVIEAAVRSIFNDLLASTTIDDPYFVQVWNLLDLVSILSDLERCEPGLIFWLIEELLDSQTIDGCRKVFDYLESRRERITAKHFSKKSLIILRSCNELLRRLSRMENTVFCGRVFIFLFQSFPLGDKSSVNLRGEYHVENTTTYDVPTPRQDTLSEQMDVDGTQAELEHASQDTKEVSNVLEDVGTSKASNGDSKGPVPPRGTTGKEDLGVPDTDILYPIFWSLQQTFSSPTRLFDTAIFRDFKNGLNLSIAKFSEVQKSLDGRVASRVIEDSRRGIKRKRNDGEDELASGFNPKYLTSRDLFELEISDLAFRRHFLVQALILLDFLLSLTAKAKAKLVDPNLTNKSVLYQYTLGDDDAKWVIDTRTTIATYLQEGPEGKFYYRMVDTVLSRDKNWVKWKAENCPPIERAALSSQDWSGAKDAAEKACGPRRLRVTPMGALDLSFLSEAEGQDGLEKLEDTQRFAVPDIKSFEAGIAEDEFDIGMARSEEDKQLAINAKASKTWRVLRIASKSRLNLFDKIDGNAQNLRPLFEPESDDGKAKDDGMADAPEIQHEDEGSSAATGAAPVAEMQESVEPGGAEASATAAVPASSFGDGGRVAPHDGP